MEKVTVVPPVASWVLILETTVAGQCQVSWSFVSCRLEKKCGWAGHGGRTSDLLHDTGEHLGGLMPEGMSLI
jgi:hypothetical protein